MEKGHDSDLKALITATVEATTSVCFKDMDNKVAEAVKLGVLIGATTGAEIGAQAAVKAIEKEQRAFRKLRQDKRIHNTKLLLRHYRSLNEHYKNAIFDVTTAEGESESFIEIMELMNGTLGNRELYVESIKKSAMRTKVIMAHVNKMLEIYELVCLKNQKGDNARRWRVLKAMYIDETFTPAIEIAKAENIDKRTVYKDIDAVVDDLTVLFFGIGGLEKR